MVQAPLHTSFGPAATAAEVALLSDLSGKTAIVTGGSSGLGLQTVKALSARGATVCVPALDISPARMALDGIERVEIYPLDLTDEASIRSFSQAFLEHRKRLDLLVLNAGVMARPLFRDAQGREGHMSINHLGHFRLTTSLWPVLRATGRSRVVVMSSRGHHMSDINFDDLDFERSVYDKWVAYGRSKTANALFAVALDARGKEHGIRSYSVHPGMIFTPGISHLSRAEFDAFGALAPDGSPIIDPARDMKTVPQGAATTVWCATAPELEEVGGVYCENCDIAAVSPDAPFGVRPYAIDRESAERLWRESVTLTGLDVAAE